MTMQNVITGFRITGVFPVHRTVIATSPLPSPKLITEELQKRTGVSFVPLYSPVVKKQHSVLTFSSDEMLLFQQRYEEGYDLAHDVRYMRWLEMYHPGHSITECSSVVQLPSKEPPSITLAPQEPPSIILACKEPPLATKKPTSSRAKDGTKTLPCCTVMSTFISKEPQVKLPEKETKTTSRVLTSEENRMIIEEKERKKKEVAEKKAENQRKRQEKKKERGIFTLAL